MEPQIHFDPNEPAQAGSGIFGLPYSEEQSRLIYIPVPWEVTTSYGGGTVNGPDAILQASAQLDVFDYDVLRPYEAGLFLRPLPDDFISLNSSMKIKAQKIKDAGGVTPELEPTLKEVNSASLKLNEWVKNQTLSVLKSNKIAAIIGGDHSVPFGAFQAASETFGSFGILHFDAHSDTREAYMGFEHSHASIMHNALTKIPQITQLTQIGIRDYCQEESEFTQSQPNRVSVFYDAAIQERKLLGESFALIAKEMISKLPEKVWVSFDIDGLNPALCPNTGTPVPGGLSFEEACFVIKLVAKSGRKVIGFDLVEVAPGSDNEWDANVGMRLLYKLTAYTLASQGLRPWTR